MCPHGHRGSKWLQSRLRRLCVLIQPWLACGTAAKLAHGYTLTSCLCGRYEPNSSAQHRGQKLRTQRGNEPDVAPLPTATSPWPDGEHAEVGSSQVESGEGCPGLLLAKQCPQAARTHLTWLACLWRQAETDSKGCTGQTGRCGLGSYLLFFSGAIYFLLMNLEMVSFSLVFHPKRFWVPDHDPVTLRT